MFYRITSFLQFGIYHLNNQVPSRYLIFLVKYLPIGAQVIDFLLSETFVLSRGIVWKLTIFCKVFFQTGNSCAILLKMSVCSKEDDFFLFWEIDMEGMTRFILGILHFRLCKYTGFQVASGEYKIKVCILRHSTHMSRKLDVCPALK